MTMIADHAMHDKDPQEVRNNLKGGELRVNFWKCIEKMEITSLGAQICEQSVEGEDRKGDEKIWSGGTVILED